jgi:epidermal growth factor receptor substrate 15
MTFYTTPESLSEPVKSSSADHEADITETQNSSMNSIQDNTVDSSKRTELAGESMNDSPISEPNISGYGEYISLKSFSAETRSKEENDRGEISKDNTEVYTESTNTGGTIKKEENDTEEVQDNTEVYTENTGTEETSMRQEIDKEKLQQDNTEVYTESTSTGEMSTKEGNDGQEIQDSTDVYTESTSSTNLVTTYSSKEDDLDMSLGQMKNKIAETWFDETTTTQPHIVDSKEAKNNKMDEYINSADGTITVKHSSDVGGMMKDGGGLWFIGEVKKYSVESVTYGTSPDTIQQEITTNTSEDDKEGGRGTESIQFKISVSSREGNVEGNANESIADDDNESETSSEEISQNKYDENNLEAGSFQNSNTTADADDHTQATEHEPRDTVPVITLQNDMESSHMGVVLPDLENKKMQVDFDIKKIETNPLAGREAEINTSLEYSNITNKNIADDLRKSELGSQTFLNSNEEENEGITTDDSSTASFTTTPTTQITSEFQTTETTEVSKFNMGLGETAYSTNLMHDSTTEAQNEEFMSPTDGSTTPDILEGEHPLNNKEFEETTEHTQTSTTEELQDATTVNSLSDHSSTEEGKAELYTSDEGTSLTELVTESFTDSFGNTDSSNETEKLYSTTQTTEHYEKVPDVAAAFKSNKAADISETSDILSKEWLAYDKLTTEKSTEVVHQTSPNEDKEQELFTTVNYSHDEISHSHESESGDKTDLPVAIDTTRPVGTTESMLTTFSSLETTEKFDNRLSNDDPQTSTDKFSNEIQTTESNGTDTGSEEMDVTSREDGTSAASDYSVKESKMSLWQISSSEHSKEDNSWKGTDASNSEVTSKENYDINEDSKLSGSDESESWNSNIHKNSGAKQPNEFDKIHQESLNSENMSNNYHQHGSDKSVPIKEVKSDYYSGDSYEQSFHDIYGPGDYYVTSSESVLTHNTTDELSEAISTVTSPSSQEQFTEIITVRSNDNEGKESYSELYVDTDTTAMPNDSSTAATNKTESALESTTPGLLKNVYNSEEIANLSEIKIGNLVEDSQDTKSENLGMFKVEEAVYDASVSSEENDSTE